MDEMNEIDVLKSIAGNLSNRKSSAALNDYLLLCNNIKYVNELFNFSVHSTGIFLKNFESALANDTLVKPELLDSTKPLYHFRKILPRIINNGINICEKLLLNTIPDNRNGVDVENVDKLQRSFIDYNNLVTSARQYIDSMVSDAYQIILLDAKSLNYHVLVSLNSFNKYVTKSIRHALFNPDIVNSLQEFEKLPFKQWNNSPITACQHQTFANKIDFLFSSLSLTDTTLSDEFKNLFKFSSEFTHIGYISTFFTSTNESEVIFCDDIGPYLPSTENFSELKYEILETAIKFYSTVYLPALSNCVLRCLASPTSTTISGLILEVSKKISADLKTRNNQYYFIIIKGLIGSDKTIPLKCMCGTVKQWKPPHNSTAYCQNCGSRFSFMEMETGTGYVFTSNGPVKPIGSDVPDFEDLPPEEQIKLLKSCEDLINKAKK